MACEFLSNRTCLWLWENIYSWPTEQLLNKAVNKESMAMQKSSLKNYLWSHFAKLRQKQIEIIFVNAWWERIYIIVCLILKAKMGACILCQKYSSCFSSNNVNVSLLSMPQLEKIPLLETGELCWQGFESFIHNHVDAGTWQRGICNSNFPHGGENKRM